MRASGANSESDPPRLHREPRPPPNAAEKAKRLKVKEEERRLPCEEYQRKQQAIDANTARLRALRLARKANG